MAKTNKLLYENHNCYDQWSKNKVKEAFDFSEQYKRFLDTVKTERLCVEEGIRALEKAGFVHYDQFKRSKILAGAKIYFNNRGKALIAVVIGKKPIEDGLNMVLTHIDSPRIDLKVNPLYEAEGFALLKTHYYGGIKKYQWPVIPLSLHGVVILHSGKKIDIHIGDRKTDPVFVITDLLPHAARKQLERKASEFITAEELNILIGGIPVSDKKAKDRVKLAILQTLNAEYGLVEEDFLSAEIEAVPAFEARDIGFDRSFVGGYGHDDRSSSYAALQALLSNKKVPERSCLVYWSDKEEVGSQGATGAQSMFLTHAVGKLVRLLHPTANEDALRDVLANSYGLSGDVDAAYDPDYVEFHDHRNTAKLNHGIVLTKYTGVGGKYMANDADAEFMGKVRKLFNDEQIVWQTGDVGKVDIGGGGTIAFLLGNLGMHIVDCGPAVLSMHAPYEILSKVDLYASYEAYRVFFEKMK